MASGFEPDVVWPDDPVDPEGDPADVAPDVEGCPDDPEPLWAAEPELAVPDEPAPLATEPDAADPLCETPLEAPPLDVPPLVVVPLPPSDCAPVLDTTPVAAPVWALLPAELPLLDDAPEPEPVLAVCPEHDARASARTDTASHEHGRFIDGFLPSSRVLCH